jgi:DNA-binding NarL/FixJ family response regulator
MRGNNSIRIVIADDHTVVREGLIAILDAIPDMCVVAQASSWPGAIAKINLHDPDIALLDVRMPGMEASEGVAVIRQMHSQLRIVLISAFDCGEDVYGVIQAGANGFLVKDCTRQEILNCLRAVFEGKTWLPPGPAAKLAARIQSPVLTGRQTGILELVAEGKTNKEVGAAMRITEGTVKVHLNHIFRKLGVDGRTQAIRRALERGIVHLSKNA